MRHVEELNDYISAAAGEAIADGYTARIIDFCKGLDLFPVRGTNRDDILPGLRTLGFQRRVTIAFVVNHDAIVIEGIFYGGRDWPAALRTP